MYEETIHATRPTRSVDTRIIQNIRRLETVCSLLGFEFSYEDYCDQGAYIL